MIIAHGTISRIRNAKFKNGREATFLEALIEHPDRAEIVEILLNDDMNAEQFSKGAKFTLAVSYYAKGDRLYCSAARVQPNGFPKIEAA